MNGDQAFSRQPSSCPKGRHFSEMGDFQRPVLGGNLRTSVLIKVCVSSVEQTGSGCILPCQVAGQNSSLLLLQSKSHLKPILLYYISSQAV